MSDIQMYSQAVPAISFPPVTTTPYNIFSNESEFCNHLMARCDFWYRIGCHVPYAYRTHSTPDFLTHVRPLKRGAKVANLPTLGVEAELEAKNFKLHGHRPSKQKIGLIVSYTCWQPVRLISGVDVVSFYRSLNGVYRYSLDEDIDYVFHGIKPPEIDDGSSDD